MRRLGRVLFAAVLAVILTACGVVGWAYLEARATPIVRKADIGLADWPAGQPPITAVLISDIHADTFVTDPGRLTRIVAQVDALHPDIILIAGDFLPGHHPLPADKVRTLIAPLAALHAPLGVVAVLGNHDYMAGADTIRPALADLGMTLLVNRAIRRGPLVIGGVDDPVTGHADVGAVVPEAHALTGAHVMITHSPIIVDDLPPDLPLLLAGHTHCGQIRLPFGNRFIPVDPFERYACGMVVVGARTTLVDAGIGTSNLPLRLGAPPDFWLLTLGPAPGRTP